MSRKLLPIAAILSLIGILYTPDAGAQSPFRRTEADALSGKRISAPSQRDAVVAETRKMMAERRDKGRRRAVELGFSPRTVRKDGTVTEVVDLDEASNQPVFMTTHNASAGISTGANRMRGVYGLVGAGVVVGVWDGGVSRVSHQEFTGGRCAAKDGGALNDHATHVSGTIAAAGVIPSAIGMSTQGGVDSYDWNSDTSEMISRARASASESGKVPLSNHSYGYVRGWNWNGSRYVWGGFSGNTAADSENYFGNYGSRTRSIDAIAHDAPYYLMFWSAGNERNNNPSTGSSVSVAGQVVAYNPALHPPGDGTYRGGYDTVADSSVAKNVVTVGAVNDAVTATTRDVSKATITSFTSWGPTDDGRIKPDLVANGASVYSTFSGTDNSYGTYSGTSMAAPNATGTAALLVGQYGGLFPGQAMRASTLKGLLIHTADDRGTPGPDYQFGWGLVDGEEAAALVADHAANPGKTRMIESLLNAGATSRVHEFAWDGVSPIRVTISWTDPEASSQWEADSRTRNLVNDLNIKMVGPDGREFYPFVMPFVGTWTQASMAVPATTGVNSTDNVEQILVASPGSQGVYRIFVTHTGSLSGGAQEYSLLVSGSEIINTAPTISPVGDLAVAEDSGTVIVEFTVSDEQTPAGQLAITATSENSGLTGDVAVGGVGGSRTVTFAPVGNANGVATVTIRAGDGSFTSEETFVVTVTPVNDAPVVSAPGNISLEPGQASEPLGVTVSDIDNDSSEIILSATSNNPELLPDGKITLSGTGWSRAVAVEVVDGQYGTASVVIAATDGTISSTASFTVTVNNPHPTMSQWLSVFGVEAGRAGAEDDPDGDGIPNSLEYFHGLEPAVQDNEIVVIQEMAGEFVVLDYRRSKSVNGVMAAVKWSTEPGIEGDWTTNGVVDYPISRDPDFDWRRAIFPWPAGHDRVFTRIDLSVSP